jgi:putative oxidoreductase
VTADPAAMVFLREDGTSYARSGMSAVTATDTSLLVFRLGLSIVFLAHGYNHIFGGGKIAGTARWFEGLGMRPGVLHAWTASITELGAGILLALGLAIPVACAGVIGTMLVAWITNHLRNGFFIFRPGEGFEYVMMLTLAAIGLAGVGAGQWSVDSALGWFDPPGWLGLGLALIAGVGGAVVLLAIFWRPARKPVPAATVDLEATD